MNQLKIKNPQMFQTIQNLMNSNGEPQKLVHQMMGSITPEQRQNILTQAKQYGAPENILSQIQNMN